MSFRLINTDHLLRIHRREEAIVVRDERFLFSFCSLFFLDFPGVNPVSVNEAQMVRGSKLNYTELSQAIHPIVGTPFLQLHPCLSQELLRTLSKR